MSPMRKQLIRGGLVALQWLCLTLALGAVVVYGSDALEGYISPRIDGGLMFVAAFFAALLLGLTVDSFKLLLPLAALMCVGASLVFVLVLFAPSFAEVTVRTTTLGNYAATRVMLYSVLMFLPAVVGAGLGNLLSDRLNDNVLGPDDLQDGVDQTSWYARRRPPSSTDGEHA